MKYGIKYIETIKKLETSHHSYKPFHYLVEETGENK